MMFTRTLLATAAVLALAIGTAFAAPAAIPADVPGDARTKARAVPGKKLTSYLQSKNDADWFRIKLGKGQTYVLAVTFGCRGADVRVLGPDKKVVRRSFWEHEYGGAVEFTTKAGGDHYLAAQPGGWNNQDCSPPSHPESQPAWPRFYEILVRGDCAGTVATRCTMKLGQRTLFVTDSYDDRDWRRLEITKAGRYRVAIFDRYADGTYVSGSGTIVLRNAKGGIVEQFHGYDRPSVDLSLAKGRYFVDAYGERLYVEVTPAGANSPQVAAAR